MKFINIKMCLDIENDVLWLKHNREPWDEVLIKWRRTFSARKQSKVTNFNDFLKEWAPLNNVKKASGLVRNFQSYRIFTL